MTKKLLILTPEDPNKIPSKTLDKHLKVVESYPRGMKNFYFDAVEYETNGFHKALEKVFELKNSFIILGKLTELGEYHLESQTSGFRRKKDPKPTIQDQESTEMVLDLDDHVLEGFDPLDPTDSIENFLDELQINCDVTWQITSSQQLITKENPNPLARIRLYFSCHKNFSLQHRKAWSQKFAESDGSVYTCSQPIYTAPPQIVGEDPIKIRFGFIKRKRRSFILPELTATEIKDNSSYSRMSGFSFDDPNLPEEVKSGKVHRRYFMPLAFHYVNKGLSKDDVFCLIAAKSENIKNREFDPQNVIEYIQDAFKHIEREKTQNEAKTDFGKEKKKEEMPVFPKNIEKCMPPVVQKLWHEFKKLPLDLNETILFPTFIAVHGFILRGKFVTSYGRIPNTLSLTLGDSSAGKDLNSTNVVNILDKLVSKNCESGYGTIFSEMLTSPDDISGGTAYIKAFNGGQDFFWMNSEATSFYSMLNNSKNMSAVTSISLKLINAFDGGSIQGSMLKDGKATTVFNANNQVIQLAQQKTIKDNLSESLIESGYFGRMNLYMVPELGKDGIKDFKLKKYSSKTPNIEKDVLDFYSNNRIWNDTNATRNQHEYVKISQEKSDQVLDLIQSVIVEKEKNKEQDEEMFKLKIPIMGRIQMTLEKFHCIFYGITKLWNMHTDDEKEYFDENFDPVKLIPLMEYLNDSKMYAIDNLIVKKSDPIFEFVIEEIDKIVSGVKKVQGVTQNKILKDYGLVSKALLKTNLTRSSGLKKDLENLRNDKDVGNKISVTIFNMIRDQILVEKEISKGLYVGVAKSY